MTVDQEERWIAEAVRRVYDESGVAWPPAGGGPAPLHRLITDSSFRATCTEVDGLNRAAVAAHLGRWGVRWADIPDPDPKLAGFVYATARSSHIFVRRGDFLPRRRFSSAHELGHLALHLGAALEGRGAEAGLTHGDVEIADAGSPHDDAMERQANRFAAVLLMPEASCREAYERLARRYGPSTRFLVHHLASELLVSREAVAWRLHGLGLGPSPKRPAGGSEDEDGGDDPA